MTGNEAPKRLAYFTNWAAKERGQPGDEQHVNYLQADEEGDAKDRQPPAAAQMAIAIDEEIVSFHLGVEHSNTSYGRACESSVLQCAQSPLVRLLEGSTKSHEPTRKSSLSW